MTEQTAVFCPVMQGTQMDPVFLMEQWLKKVSLQLHKLWNNLKYPGWSGDLITQQGTVKTICCHGVLSVPLGGNTINCICKFALFIDTLVLEAIVRSATSNQ